MADEAVVINERKGDTLVEVLISIAIVGSVLMGAYALASRSLQSGISAAEHSEAIQLAQGQVERLKYRERLSSQDVWNNFTIQSGHFCLDDAKDQNDPKWLPVNNSNPNNLVVTAGGNLGYSSECVDPSATPKYFINISTPSPIPPGTNPTYQITVRWVAIGGNQAESKIYYRF